MFQTKYPERFHFFTHKLSSSQWGGYDLSTKKFDKGGKVGGVKSCVTAFIDDP